MDRLGALGWKTRETQGTISINLDEPAAPVVETQVKMLTHLLEQIGQHGRFGLEIKVTGDVATRGFHHTVEDTGIRLGKALGEALGDRSGIFRMADATVPLDEARAKVAVDLAERPYFVFDPWERLPVLSQFMAEDVPFAQITHFLESMALNGRFGLHVVLEREGRDGHHCAEAIAKALARALFFATRFDPTLKGAVASTKGIA